MKIIGKTIYRGDEIIECRSPEVAIAKSIEMATAHDTTRVDPDTTESPAPKVGDFVQWSPGGIDQFKKPKKLTRVEEGHGFVRGSETGMPLDELTLPKE